MQTTELIGTIIVLLALAVLTAQVAYDFGRRHGVKAERQLADRRVQGVLDYENKRRPKARKNKLKASRRAARLAVGSVGMVTLLGGWQ